MVQGLSVPHPFHVLCEKGGKPRIPPYRNSENAFVAEKQHSGRFLFAAHHATASTVFARPASAAAISLCRRNLGRASRFAPERTQTPSDPVARTEESHEQPRQVKVRVDSREMNAKPRRRDFDFR
jgi:hypothetical protein